MDRIASASEKERKAIFLETAKIKNISDVMVEKDFWVTWVLGRMFGDEFLKKSLCFKGGTSLSKVFHLIDRFSEDIDLILDWRLITSEDVFKKSNTKQVLFNDQLEDKSHSFIATELKSRIQNRVSPICEVSIDSDDGNCLNVSYPKSIGDEYIKPYIKLEIGPLAAWNPNDVFPITSYVAEANSELEIKDVFVPTIKAERTFWEKATILHREHFRPENTNTPIRYSRHYYDLYKMASSPIKESAFSKLDLLKTVVEFKNIFYHCKWAKYEFATHGNLKLIPSDTNLALLKNDYKAMRSMIYGDYPSWENIISSLSKLETEINNLMV